MKRNNSLVPETAKEYLQYQSAVMDQLREITHAQADINFITLTYTR